MQVDQNKWKGYDSLELVVTRLQDTTTPKLGPKDTTGFA